MPIKLDEEAVESSARWLFSKIYIDFIFNLYEQTKQLDKTSRDAIVKRFNEIFLSDWLIGNMGNMGNIGNKMKKKVADIKGVVKRQKRYSTLAKNEGKYAQKKAAKESKNHMPEMAKDSKQEAKIAFSFADKRKKIAESEAKKLPKKSK